MRLLHKALRYYHPGREFRAVGEEVEFLDTNTLLSQQEVDKLKSDYQKIYDNEEYKRQRKNLYPSTDELLVALWEREVEGRPEYAQELEKKRQDIKAQYPKPNGGN